ncbi:hypothetical protein BpHYR1_030618 [Brachionus plicatilis]|uniref:Uncharacterized protein n=1 Tax=Brachionus plicatilis TaxID=10195 RepID=A0A3M7Q2L5_BRAPC|nr:hypothetical protein BpHYR1_030618 [Brachionus plicatilis]
MIMNFKLLKIYYKPRIANAFDFVRNEIITHIIFEYEESFLLNIKIRNLFNIIHSFNANYIKSETLFRIIKFFQLIFFYPYGYN